MPEIVTPNFGQIHYEPRDLLHFPYGLPAFERESHFLCHAPPETAPVVFLQSLRTPSLAFMTLPVQLVLPGYQLQVSEEDRISLGLPPDRPLVDGIDVWCLAILTSTGDGRITANLQAPVVINLASRAALQCIRNDNLYSSQFLLVSRREAS